MGIFHTLPKDKKMEILSRILEFQNGKCFLCEEEIEKLALNNVEEFLRKYEVDHKIALSEGGRDDESNWVILHKECNRKKGAKPLLLSKRLWSFERDKRKFGDEFKLGKVLEIFRGIDGNPLKLRILGENKVEISYKNEKGIETVEQLPIYEDPSGSGFTFIFTNLPIAYIFHDADLNPRPISEKDANLIEEFYYKNPQLHVCLCRIEEVGEKGGWKEVKVLLYDGQHKAVAQIYNERKYLPVRIFLKYDKERLKTVNFRAHTELVQMEFFRSITAEVGSGLFADKFKEYLNKHSSEIVSERKFFESIESHKEREELRKNFLLWLEYNILHPEKIHLGKENKMTKFIEAEKTRERQKPISYDSFKKTFIKFFVYKDFAEEPIASTEYSNYLRFIERDNLVKLMNIIAEEVLVGKFEEKIGAHKLEERIRKGVKVPDEHIKAYRIFRPKVFEVWCEILSEAIKAFLKLRGRLSEGYAKEGKILWCKITDEDWEQIKKMVNRIIDHKLWETKEPVIIEAIGTTKKDVALKLITEGKIRVGSEERKVFEPPIDSRYVLDIRF
jgi:hypothetical protein